MDEVAVRTVNEALASPCPVPEDDGHLAWVLARVEQVHGIARGAGLTPQEMIVYADAELNEHLEAHFPHVDRYTELPSRREGDVLVLLDTGPDQGCGYTLRVLTGNGWVDLALHESPGFAYPKPRPCGEVEVRWRLQVTDGVDPATARTAAVPLGS